MNRTQFINALRQNLKGIPVGEQHDILAEYNEHFSMGLESGKSEDEIAKALGDPRSIAREYKAMYLVGEAQNTGSARGLFSAVVAVVGLGFFNLIFVLGPFLGALGVLIGLFAAGGGVTVAGLALMVGLVAEPIFPGMVSISLNPAVIILTSIGLSCLGVLMLIGVWYLTKVFFRLTVRYLKWNVRVVSGKGA